MNKEIDLKPITPDMADDWGEHILRSLPQSFAINFTTLATKVYDRLEQLELSPRGSVASAVLAMVTQGELELTDQGNIRNAFTESTAA